MSKIKSVFLLLFIVFQSVSAQTEKKLPLKTILIALEKQHNVRFNFLDDAIRPFTVVPPKPEIPLQKKLEYLSGLTTLKFDFIDATSISIFTAEKEKAPEIAPDKMIQEVVVTNYLTTGIAKKTDGSYLVSPKKFGILPGLTEADVLQTMQQIPGVVSIDETVSNINVRGGTHDQNLFTWNGIRMFQTGHLFGMISAFNPFLPQEFKIYKNGSPAFYGESVSSVTDISTQSGTIEKTNAGIGINLISAEFYARIKASEKASFTISGRRSYTDLMATQTYDNYAGRVFQNTVITDLDGNQEIQYGSDEDFYFYDLTAQYLQKIGTRHELAVDAIAISNALEVYQNKINLSDPNLSMSKRNTFEQQNYGGNLSWKTHWNDRNTTHVNFYASHYNLDALNQSLETNQILNQQNTVFDTGLRLENQHRISEQFRFNNGYQFNEIGISNYDNINTPAFSRRTKKVLRSHAFILEGRYDSKNRKVFLQTGMRFNYLSQLDVFLAEPRFQFNYSLTDYLKVEILGEYKSQTASQIIELQQDFLGLEKRRWTLTDNDKNPIQKSRQMSFGLTYKKNGWLFTIDNFYKNVKGISSRSQSFQNQLEFERIPGKYIVLGTEVLVQKNFKSFYTWLSYSYNDNQYTFTSYIPPQFANNFEIVQTVSWAGIYEHKNLKIALGSKWFTGKPVTTPASPILDMSNPSAPEIVYNNPNNARLEDYFQVNLSAAYQWNLEQKSNLQVGISLLNVLDRRNVINRYYRVNSTANGIEQVNTYSLERTPNVSIKYNF